jgi:hypothetical protein
MPYFIGNNFNYKTVAASQTTAQICGEGGYLESITVIPASSTPQTVALLDGSTTLFTIVTGAGGDTKPYTIRIGGFAESSGGFKVTTGASVSVIVSGNKA